MSMTLLQMANSICRTVGQFDAVSLDACKGYLVEGYNYVWDEYFWRDSQLVSQVVLPSGDNTFPLPDGMDRIVSIGNPGGTFLDPVDESFLLEASPNILISSGIPQYYTEIRQSDAIPPGGVTVYPIPDQQTTFYVFGKRVFPGLSSDDSVSVLRNCDRAIMAFAQSKMLERARQYEKGKNKYQEALALLEKAKSVEHDQANRPRTSKNLTVAGNSLAEMTDAVCAICGAWTPDIRIVIQEFLRRNYVSLYQLMLWPESTVVVRVVSGEEQLILPHYVDRVIQARTADGQRLMPNDVSYLFAVSPMVFESTGTPVSMSILTPVGVGSLPANPPEGLLLASSDPADAGRRVFIRGESGSTEVSEQVILDDPATTPVLTRYSYDVPITIAKPVTRGDLTVNGATTMFLYQFIPAAERERKQQRVWLLPPRPSTAPPVTECAQGVMILGKRKIVPLQTEEDTPIITGAQGVLIAGAAADLYGRLGNADLSQKYASRAEAATRVLVSENTDQAAYSPKLTPVVEPSALGIGVDECWSKL